MTRTLGSYTPRDVSTKDWAVIGPYIADVFEQIPSDGQKDPIHPVHTITAYVRWAHLDQGVALEHEHIFDRLRIAQYAEQVLAYRSGRYIATSRSRLLSAARAVGCLDDTLTPQGRAPLSKLPYSPDRIEALLAATHAIESPYVRRSALLTFALSAGAGLNVPDYTYLRNRHLHISPDPDQTVLVTVPESGGSSSQNLLPRTVPVRRCWTELLRVLMLGHDLDPDAFVVFENITTEKRSNPRALTQGVYRHIRDADQRFDVDSLRATWITSHMRLRAPMPELLDAAGLRSAESLFRYVPYTQRCDEQESVDLLGR